MERLLITGYKSLIEDILPKLDADNYPYAVELAQIPNSIRGFGPVKLKAIRQAESLKTELLAKFAGVRAEPKAGTVKKIEPAE